ncbi:MAG TPA: Rne/Rng family ribonuclease [Candidatus Nanopelagicales bacterium]|nr:Rne/Rng family ribonuclease [Candidatus Nanopelagicales bacterium]
MSTTDDSTSSAPPAEQTDQPTATPRRRRAASRPAGPPADDAATAQPAEPAAKKTTRARAKKVAPAATPAAGGDAAPKAPARRRAARKTAPATAAGPDFSTPAPADAVVDAAAVPAPLMFQAPADVTTAAPRRSKRAATTAAATTEPATTAPEAEPVAKKAAKKTAKKAAKKGVKKAAADGQDAPESDAADEPAVQDDGQAPDVEAAPSAGDESDEPGEGTRRRRRRGGRGRRRRSADGESAEAGDATAEPAADEDAAADAAAAGESEDGAEDEADAEGEGSSRRRRRRRKRGASGGDDGAGPSGKAGRTRRNDEITTLKGSTRLEAKKQRRREGREAGRRRPSILTEAEFLARREAVDRVMVVREQTDRIQIAVLEDGVLVEHYVNRSSGASMIGNVYLGKVQNVLPSMEAAFIDIGRGRNAVLYAGEVNWDAAGLDGQPRRIEAALKSGDSVLVQVTKDPIGHKGARLTSQISLPGRFLVYVPEGQMTGISRKLPDTERSRLKSILRTIVPESAGVIVRTAAEGASEEELTRDVTRLAEQWEAISATAKSASAPALLQGEPDLAIKVVRDIFNEDFHRLVVSGDGVWDVLHEYVEGMAPDLLPRLERWTGPGEVFHELRVDEQLTKALDRKVWLPSGGSLVIDRTEAMTVVDVNTGKFTGSGGNLEETVTRNNIEAAEEIVRQLRLRDIGGIIVVDFIDMVLESNRDLVLRRLLECLGRDRTKHQVAEVTSLGLVQMTRKRIGQGLLEVFSEPCEHCNGRGAIVHAEPVEAKGPRGGDAVANRGASEGAAKVHAAARRRAAAAAGEPVEDDAAAATETAATAEKPATKAKGGKKVTSAKPASRTKGSASAEPADPDPTGTEPTALNRPTEPAADPTPPDVPVATRKRGTRRRATRSAGPAATEPVAAATTGVPEATASPESAKVPV